MKVLRHGGCGRSAEHGRLLNPGRSGLAGIVCLVLWAGARLECEVVINEVIADNRDTRPVDIDGGTPDMVELFNTSTTEAVVLGAETDSESYYLSDECAADTGQELCAFPEDDPSAWSFPEGTVIQPGGHLVIFCDDQATQGLCELHASFQIDNDGGEPIILWGPEDPTTGVRPIADRVFLPPLPTDVSFGRSPDGAGGPNVPLEQTFDVFVYSGEGDATFGTCKDTELPCRGGASGVQRECVGEENPERAARGKFSPEVELVDFSTNHPDEGEPVVLWVEVRDDLPPSPTSSPPNIERVDLLYWVDTVDGGQQKSAAMTFEGLFDGAADGRPLAFHSVWRGDIPPQQAGSIVEFQFVVEDKDGTDPGEDLDEPCPARMGPCNELGLPGPDWHPESDFWEECEEERDLPLDFENEKEDCNVPYRYRVAHDPGEVLRRLVINEIMPRQTNLIRDETETNPANFWEDYIELYNGSDVEIDLGGLWLSDRPFEPQGTPFPEGATIAPGQYLIVWLDTDGYRCVTENPDDVDENSPEKCPDPTDPTADRYHTDFALAAEGEQIYLFDRLQAGLGLIHGHRFGPQVKPSVGFALCPDGSPSGEFVDERGTPLKPNGCATAEVSFIRGDVNGNCGVNLADAVFLFAHLFQSGAAPPCPDAADVDDNGSLGIGDGIFLLNYQFNSGRDPIAPGPRCPGPDPTDDVLGECAPTDCGCIQ